MEPRLHEAIRYPDASFPYEMFIITPQAVNPKGRGFNDLHWHDELQFTIVTKGKIGMRVNGIDHELESGEAIFINKGALHVSKELIHNSNYVTFNFSEKLIGFNADSNMDRNYVQPFTNSFLFSLVLKQDSTWQREIIDKLFEIKQIFEQEKYYGWEYEISVKTTQLWFTLISNVTLTNEESLKIFKQQQERMQLMVSYIHQNYSDSLSLQTIAASAHISPSECNRSFKRTVHMTAYDYLIHYRLKKSCELLVTTEYSITEIADYTGFNHVNHFIQSFKKHYQLTPKQYRKINVINNP